jgi:hypothetical protein
MELTRPEPPLAPPPSVNDAYHINIKKADSSSSDTHTYYIHD